eukprot:1161267-Pelagomonas_calceolata.AAC.3
MKYIWRMHVGLANCNCIALHCLASVPVWGLHCLASVPVWGLHCNAVAKDCKDWPGSNQQIGSGSTISNHNQN